MTGSTCSTWIEPYLALSVAEAAKIAGRSQRTVELWAQTFGLGQRAHSTGSSPWVLCRPVFLSFVEGEQGKQEALRYLEGEPPGPRLRFHFERLKKI